MTAQAPRAVFGVPAYNHAHQFKEALESLLLQTYTDFRIVVSDDGSTDGTPDLVQDYARADDRVVYRRTDRRLGYIGNARRCFELARELFPETEYFAWGSDHDVWHPLWLERLVAALDENREAVLAFPGTFRIEGDGRVLATRCFDLTTVGEPSPLARFAATFQGMSAGNMVYGLMRSDALERAGVLRWQLVPDRLLISELSLYGHIVGVPDVLWYRRYRGLASIERQKRASFFEYRPSYLHLPWWAAHGLELHRRYGREPEPDSPIGRSEGRILARRYATLGAALVFRRWRWRVWRRSRRAGLAVAHRAIAVAGAPIVLLAAVGGRRAPVRKAPRQAMRAAKRSARAGRRAVRKAWRTGPRTAFRAARRIARTGRHAARKALRHVGPRAVLRAVRAGISAVPGQPHRYLRPLYLPLASVVFRRQKG